METICGIYKIASPSGKVYIGQAVSIYVRWNIYKYLQCKRQPKLYASLKKHGPENHKFEVLEECPEESLNEREIYYIKFFDSFNTPHGMNMQSGGDHARPDDATKLKISNKGRSKSDEEIQKNRIAHTGKKQSAETIEKRVSKTRGRVQSDEEVSNRVRKLKERGVYEKIVKIVKQKAIEGGYKSSKKVYQLDKNTEDILNVFPSIKIAVKYIGVTGISDCVNGRAETAGGYKWKLEKDLTNEDMLAIQEKFDSNYKFHNIKHERIKEQKRSDTTIEKQKLAWAKRKNSPEWNSQEQKSKRSESQSIKSRKMWDRKKNSIEWNSETERKKRKDIAMANKGKKVCQLNDNGDILNIFPSVKDALKFVKITGGIERAISGKFKMAGGYKWKWYKDLSDEERDIFQERLTMIF